MTTTKKQENAKRKVESKKQKAESERQLRVGQAGESSVYKLQMERTRRSHMTANAICEAHLQQQEKENGMLRCRIEL